MKFIKKISLLVMLTLLMAVGCKVDDQPTVSTPEVVSVNPNDKSTDVAINSSIEIEFSKEMAATTINSTTFVLTEGGNKVLGSVTYLNQIATFSPTDNLKVGVLYTGTLSTGVQDLGGISIESDFTFSFTTSTSVDVTSPTVTVTDPINNATNVARNKVISITFSENMSASSFTTSSFTVVQGVTPVTGSIEFANRTGRFIPDNLLDPDVVYTAIVNTSVKDLAGNALVTSKSWSFTTGVQAGLSVVNLRASGNYVILAKTAINNSPTSAIVGHIGLSPAATSYITGFGLTDATGYATSPQVTGVEF